VTNALQSAGDAHRNAGPRNLAARIVPFSITICGLEELPGHCQVGVSHVLSILDPEWPVPEAFGAFGEHAKLELRFHDVIEDQGGEVIPPQSEHVGNFLPLGVICRRANISLSIAMLAFPARLRPWPSFLRRLVRTYRARRSSNRF
jgi:hypothetical protein